MNGSKKTDVDSGKRASLPSDVAEKMKALERKNRELRQANEILRKASAFSPPLSVCKQTPAGQRSGARPPTEAMISFIDEHRPMCGVEPICRVLPIAPSTYYENIANRLDVDRLSARARRNITLKIEIRRVEAESRQLRETLEMSWKPSGNENLCSKHENKR